MLSREAFEDFLAEIIKDDPDTMQIMMNTDDADRLGITTRHYDSESNMSFAILGDFVVYMHDQQEAGTITTLAAEDFVN